MPVHVTSSPPPAPEINPAAPLNEDQEKAYGIILKHYSSPSYAIPTVEAEKAGLTEEERFWLVRVFSLHFMGCSQMNFQTRECLLR
jgi:hypothetical protein